MEQPDQQSQSNQETSQIDQGTNTTTSQSLSVNKKERKKKLLKIFFCVLAAILLIILIKPIFLKVYVLLKAKKEFAEVAEMDWEIHAQYLEARNRTLKEQIPKIRGVIFSLSPNENLEYLERYLSENFIPKKTSDMSWRDYDQQLESKREELKEQIYLLQETHTALLPEENYQGWETYINSNFGLSFRRPYGDQFISDIKDNYSDQTTITVKNRAGNQLCYMEISYMDSSHYHPARGTDIIEYAAFGPPTYEEWVPSFNIAGLPSVHKIEYKKDSGVGPRTDYYEFIKEEQAFLVRALSLNKEEESPVCKKILRSFGFNGEITESSKERIFKPIEFTLENGLRKGNSLKFTAQIPSTAFLRHSETEENDFVVIQDNNFRLEVGKVYGSVSMGMLEYKKVFTHSQFKEIYKITSSGINHYYYSNYLLGENEKCNIKIGGGDTACALDNIRVDERYAFYLFCDADKDNVQACDDIVESFHVEEK